MSSTKILVGIDGTGPMSDATYDKEMETSFVNRLAWKAGDNYGYWRGPIVTGGGLERAVNQAFHFIEEKVHSTRGLTNVLLTGYSRGATGIVVLANRLQVSEITVRAMLLFDCVDMHASLDAATIPQNVKNVLHLTRHPDSGSRSSWGNDALWYYPDHTKMERWSYLCTHGALGGVPSSPSGDETAGDLVKESATVGKTNVTYADDARISAVIWADIQSFCLQHGFI
jgi:hypothetical protein